MNTPTPETVTTKPRLIPFEDGVKEEVLLIQTVKDAIVDLVETSGSLAQELTLQIRDHRRRLQKIFGDDENQIYLMQLLSGSTNPEGFLYWDVEGKLSVYEFASELLSRILLSGYEPQKAPKPDE